MVRVVLDAAGGQAVRVLPVLPPQLQQPLEQALHGAEPDWEVPRPEDWGRGGGWGSQRVLLASGLSCAHKPLVYLCHIFEPCFCITPYF